MSAPYDVTIDQNSVLLTYMHQGNLKTIQLTDVKWSVDPQSRTSTITAATATESYPQYVTAHGGTSMTCPPA